MQETNYDKNSKVLNQKDEVISFKCELQENLQKAMKEFVEEHPNWDQYRICLLYTSPSPRDRTRSRMPSSA